jgi:RecA-family ATPase
MRANSVQLAKKGSPMGHVPIAALDNTKTMWVKIVVQTVPVDLQQLTGQRRVKHVSRAKPHRLQKMCANSVQLAKKGSPMGYVPVAARANTKTRWVKLLVQIVARANTKTTRVKILVNCVHLDITKTTRVKIIV